MRHMMKAAKRVRPPPQIIIHSFEPSSRGNVMVASQLCLSAKATSYRPKAIRPRLSANRALKTRSDRGAPSPLPYISVGMRAALLFSDFSVLT